MTTLNSKLSTELARTAGNFSWQDAEELKKRYPSHTNEIDSYAIAMFDPAISALEDEALAANGFGKELRLASYLLDVALEQLRVNPKSSVEEKLSWLERVAVYGRGYEKKVLPELDRILAEEQSVAVRLAVVDVLSGLQKNEDVFSRLATLSNDASVEVAVRSISALADFETQAGVARLLPALLHRNAAISQAAVEALARQDSALVLPELKRLQKNAELLPSVLIEMYGLFLHHGDAAEQRRAFENLIAVLESGDSQTHDRAFAVLQFAVEAKPEAFKPLLREAATSSHILASEEGLGKIVAAADVLHLLAALGEDSSISALIANKSKDENMIAKALSGLENRTAQVAAARWKKGGKITPTDFSYAQAIGIADSALARNMMLAAGAEKSSSTQRKEALNLLTVAAAGGIDEKNALGLCRVLVCLLEDADAAVVTNAALALNAFDEQAVPVLAEALSHAAPIVQKQCAQILSEMTHSSALSQLTQALSHSNPSVRKISYEALLARNSSGEANADLLSLLESADASVRLQGGIL